MRTLPLPIICVLLACDVETTALAPIENRVSSEQTELNLGTVWPTIAATADARFHKTGPDSVHLRARIEPAAAPFSLLADGVTLTGDTASMGVRFQPFSEGTFAARLIVEHDGDPAADGTRVLSVQLTGSTRPLPDCNDDNVCTADQFDPMSASGCVHVPVSGSCDDRSVCTESDRCARGVCIGTPITCDDAIACTADTCDPALGCQFLPTASLCGDTDPCTTDLCAPGPAADDRGCTHATASDGTLCGEASCASLPLCIAGECHVTRAPNGFPCEDGDICTSEDVCSEGACVAGAGSPLAFSAPVVVREGPTPPPRHDEDGGDAPQNEGVPADMDEMYPTTLFGQWPVAVDAIAPVITSWQQGTADALILWRGTPSDEACYLQPSGCLAPACLGATDTGLKLNATSVTSSGSAYANQMVDFDTAYQVAQQELGYPWTGESVPHSVAAVATTANADSLFGASLVYFRSTCDACTSLYPPPTVDAGPPSGAAERPCSPSLTALVPFSTFGGYVQTMEPHVIGAGIDATTLWRDESGAPLIATAVDGERFAAVYGTASELDCDCYPENNCACDVLVQVHARIYRINPLEASALPLSFLSAESLSFQAHAPVDGRALQFTQLRAEFADGYVRATWLMTGSAPLVTPASCAYLVPPPAWDAYSLTVTMDDLYSAVPALGRAQVRAAGLVSSGERSGWMSWSSQNPPGDGTSCSVLDAVRFEGDGFSEQLLERNGEVATPLSSMNPMNISGRAYAVATDWDGALVVASPATAAQPLLVASTSAAPGSDLRIHPNALARMTMLPSGLMVGALGETGLYRNRFASPALAVATMQCGTAFP